MHPAPGWILPGYQAAQCDAALALFEQHGSRCVQPVRERRRPMRRAESVFALRSSSAARNNLSLRPDEFIRVVTRFEMALTAIRPVRVGRSDLLNSGRSCMTGDAVAAELETMRNWRRRMIIRRAGQLWPR